MGTSWYDVSYMGKKQKRYFKFLDTILIKQLKEAVKQEGKLEPELFDQIIRLTGRQNTISMAIAKMYGDVIADQRMNDIEFLIEQMSPEELQKAIQHPRWKNRNWTDRDWR